MLPIRMSTDVYIEVERVLPGPELWQQTDVHYPGDDLLCLPNGDVSGTCGKKGEFSNTQGFSRALLSSLTVKGDHVPLLIADAVDFWSELSDRAGLDSWLALLSVEVDLRKFVGHWVVNGFEDVYVRTAARVCEKGQRLRRTTLGPCTATVRASSPRRTRWGS